MSSKLRRNSGECRSIFPAFRALTESFSMMLKMMMMSKLPISNSHLRSLAALSTSTILALTLSACQGLQPGGTDGGGGNPPADITSVNHIIFMLQENRSFDTYFGQLPAYWTANGL